MRLSLQCFSNDLEDIGHYHTDRTIYSSQLNHLAPFWRTQNFIAKFTGVARSRKLLVKGWRARRSQKLIPLGPHSLLQTHWGLQWRRITMFVRGPC
ncbi:hypothetical protein PZA11_002118 [Diplocarpon coronariae]